MTLLAEDAVKDYAIVPLLLSAIATLGAVVVVLFWQLVKKTDASAVREKEIATEAKADGQAAGKLISESTAQSTVLAGKIQELIEHMRESDEERRGYVVSMSAKLDDVVKTVERCGGRS